MTCLETLPPPPLAERSIAVLETKRLVLRAPRLVDAKAVAALANDRRIADNTARIPHPYRMADAESWIGDTNTEAGDAIFLITLADDSPLDKAGMKPPATSDWTIQQLEDLIRGAASIPKASGRSPRDQSPVSPTRPSRRRSHGCRGDASCTTGR